MTTATQTARTTRGRRAGIALAALVVLTGLAGCGAAADSSSTPSAPAAAADGTKIALVEFAISGATPTYAAGKTDITITNNGVVDHELLIFKSDLAPAAYPVDGNGKIVEEGAGVSKVSDGDNITAGKSQQRAIELSKGTYLFVCNLPGHFKSGMFTVVRVA